jgi:putative ABC transport system permease protein
MPTLFTIALRNVTRNRRRTLMTLAALVVGVSVLISVRGLMNGLQHALVQSVAEAQTGALQVHRKGYLTNVLSSPLGLNMPVSVLETVRPVEGVKAVAGRIGFAGMVSNGDDTLFTSFIAVDPAAELQVCPVREKLLDPGSAFVGGRGFPEDGALLTGELARSIHLAPGGEAALLAPDIDGALSGENMHLAGTMFLPMPGEKKVGMVPLALAQRLLKMEGRVTEVAVALDRLEDTEVVAARLRQVLGPDLEVHTWSELVMFVQQAMTRQNFVIAVIGVAFLLLMLLGVANTMVMSTLERTREIGTMMAVGLRRGSILVLFVLEALFLGLLGAVLGSGVGVGVVLWMGQHGIEVIAPGSHVPFIINPRIAPGYVGGVVLAAAAGAALFSLYPAWRASRLRPVQALAGQ